MYDRNKNIFAYLLDLFIYLSPIKLFKFVPRSIITILHEKCIEISNKWTSLTPLQKQINQEPQGKKRESCRRLEPPVSLSDYHRYQAPRRGGSPLERTGSPSPSKDGHSGIIIRKED